MGEIAIEVSHLTKTYKLYENNKRRIIEALFPPAKPQYKEFHALNDISFNVKKGEIVGIIGKNGSGKSTLLKIITGVLNASKGNMAIEGRISALLELGAGFNPEYTGLENIYLNGTLNRVTHEEVEKRIEAIAEFADIGDFIYQPVKNYSSGMFVRLAFAVAVYSDPDILIVDEALAVGDAAFQAKCMARMHQIMKSGATVIFVTHDMNTIKRLCQRCIYLEEGKKIMEGPAEELADIYLRRIRSSMNEEHLKIKETKLSESSRSNDSKVKRESFNEDIEAIENKEFMEKTNQFKEGTGAVEFVDVKLLSKDNVETFSYAYNQTLKIRLKLRVNEDVNNFSVAYHIRDDKNMELIGTSVNRELGRMLNAKKGECYEIEFSTKLPLIEGNYNITVLASSPVIKNRTALFLSLLENAAIFAVEENQKIKLWDKVYIKNEVSVTKLK